MSNAETVAATTRVFSFNKIVVDGDVSTLSGTATVMDRPVYAGNTLTVNLSGVADAQTVMCALSNVRDAPGRTMPTATIPVVFLRGDTNADGLVNSGDAVQTRSRSGQATDASNWRSDVNGDGVINSGDAAIVRGNAGSGVNP